jgi:hypothetical protein
MHSPSTNSSCPTSGFNPEATSFVPSQPGEFQNSELGQQSRQRRRKTRRRKRKATDKSAPSPEDPDDQQTSSEAPDTRPSSEAEAPEETPHYGQALVWKSATVKNQEEYVRIRRHVRAIAPELFKDSARPTNERANIIPQTPTEWATFKWASVKAEVEDLEDNITKMSDQINSAEKLKTGGVPQEKRVPQSAFANKTGPTKFQDGRSAVLAQPSIWSGDHVHADVPRAEWPSRAELLWHGDNRTHDASGKRLERSLPPPRVPAAKPDQSFSERLRIIPHALDQVGNLTANASECILKRTQQQIDAANHEMDNDAEFAAQAMHFLGGDLMSAIGIGQAPVNTTAATEEGQADEAILQQVGQPKQDEDLDRDNQPEKLEQTPTQPRVPEIPQPQQAEQKGKSKQLSFPDDENQQLAAAAVSQFRQNEAAVEAGADPESIPHTPYGIFAGADPAGLTGTFEDSDRPRRYGNWKIPNDWIFMGKSTYMHDPACEDIWLLPSGRTLRFSKDHGWLQ